MTAALLRRHAGEHPLPVVPGPFGIGDSVAWTSLNSFARSHRLHVELAAGCGVALHAPYLDDAVVRACWSVPAAYRASPIGHAKPLLDAGLGDLLPAALTQRRTKGDYTALAYRGMARNAPMLHDLFTRSRLAELGLIDDVAVQVAIGRGAAGVPIRLGAVNSLIGTELWLRAQDKPAGGVPAERGGERAGHA
jgi:asparagine synthase (glutamine-hydrolysing)